MIISRITQRKEEKAKKEEDVPNDVVPEAYQDAPQEAAHCPFEHWAHNIATRDRSRNTCDLC